MPAFYSPDFLVRTVDTVFWVETKAQEQVNNPNVQRKLKAANAGCERINALPDEPGQLRWRYVLLVERRFAEWRSKGARLPELLDFARVRTLADVTTQGRLGF